MEKKGQIMSIESYIAIVIIIIVITGFYFIMVAKDEEEDTSNDNVKAGILTQQVVDNPMLDDKIITVEEIDILAAKDCDQLKKLFETQKNICVYFKDKNNQTVKIKNATGLGCPGLNISDKVCGNMS